jgi:hypothetical protein
MKKWLDILHVHYFCGSFGLDESGGLVFVVDTGAVWVIYLLLY